jgi:hypothetical protein
VPLICRWRLTATSVAVADVQAQMPYLDVLLAVAV